jgi:hypothetical protein
MDNFKEEVVTRKGSKVLSTVYYLLTYVFLAVFGIIGMIGLMSLMNLEFTLGAVLRALLGFGSCWFLWRSKDNINIEYEYTYTSGEMDYAKVMGGRRRKHLLTLRLKDAEAGGLADGDRFNRYQSMQGVKKIDMTLNFDAKKYFIYFIREGNKHLLTMECSDEMWDMILKTNPRLGA